MRGHRLEAGSNIYSDPHMASLSTRASIASRAVHGCIAGRQFWANRPANAFTREGYEVIDGFLDRAECERLVALAVRNLAGPSHRVAGNCYTWVKAESTHGRNRNVRELLNVDDLDDGVARLMRDRAVHTLFEARLGERVEMYGFSIQFDDIDTTTKRGFHINQYAPPLFKAFIYLNDVLDEGDGPYTIVPGSHRWGTRRLVNDLVNAATSGARRDMRYLVADSDVRTGTGSCRHLDPLDPGRSAQGVVEPLANAPARAHRLRDHGAALPRRPAHRRGRNARQTKGSGRLNRSDPAAVTQHGRTHAVVEKQHVDSEDHRAEDQQPRIKPHRHRDQAMEDQAGGKTPRPERSVPEGEGQEELEADRADGQSLDGQRALCQHRKRKPVEQHLAAQICLVEFRGR